VLSCFRTVRDLHRRVGPHVPYKRLVEHRAIYMADAARAVSGIPRADPAGGSVLTSSNRLSTLHRWIACARLSQPCLTGSCPDFSATLTTMALTTAACGSLRSAPDCRTRRALFISVQLRNAVWTGATRDTRPNSDINPCARGAPDFRSDLHQNRFRKRRRQMIDEDAN
jgi:hypothetical protein